MKYRIRTWLAAAAVVGGALLVLNASIAQGAREPGIPSQGGQSAHIVSVWETIAQAGVAQANLKQAEIQTLQTLVVAEHAQACLMANDQRHSVRGFWGEAPTPKAEAAEKAWVSLNCENFFEAAGSARVQQAIEEAQ